MKFSIEDFFCKCVQIRSKLRIWSDLPKKSLIESFIFCAVFSQKKPFIIDRCLIRSLNTSLKINRWRIPRANSYVIGQFTGVARLLFVASALDKNFIIMTVSYLIWILLHKLRLKILRHSTYIPLPK